MRSLNYGNGVTNEYQYDLLNRLANLVWQANSSLVASYGYQLKPGGTRISLMEPNGSGANGTNYAWSYDNLYRLTNEVISGLGIVGYGYDGVGNRTNRQSSITGLATSASYTYDTNDQLTASASLGSYTSDNNGNIIAPPGAGGEFRL